MLRHVGHMAVQMQRADSEKPEDYVPIFRDAGIGLVVRLNKKQCACLEHPTLTAKSCRCVAGTLTRKRVSLLVIRPANNLGITFATCYLGYALKP